MSIESLPYELLVKIAEDLPYPDLVNLCQTSQEYYQLCLDDNFWKKKLFATFGYWTCQPIINWRNTYDLIYRYKVFVDYFVNQAKKYLKNPSYFTGYMNNLLNRLNSYKSIYQDSLSFYKPRDTDQLKPVNNFIISLTPGVISMYLPLIINDIFIYYGAYIYTNYKSYLKYPGLELDNKYYLNIEDVDKITLPTRDLKLLIDLTNQDYQYLTQNLTLDKNGITYFFFTPSFFVCLVEIIINKINTLK